MKRRQFLQSAGGATLFTILPRRLLAGSGATPPSETVNVASIGRPPFPKQLHGVTHTR